MYTAHQEPLLPSRADNLVVQRRIQVVQSAEAVRPEGQAEPAVAEPVVLLKYSYSAYPGESAKRHRAR